MADNLKRFAAQVPTEWNTRNLRACIACNLLKTYDQFLTNGCENCAFMDMHQQPDRVLEATTTSFTGTCMSVDPDNSWVGRWIGCAGFVPGLYAVSVSPPMDVTEEFAEILERNGIDFK